MDHVFSVVLTFFVHFLNPTPNANAKVTVTADVTGEPSVTPTVTPTGTVTPTVTPSVTPSISPRPTDGDKDDMLGLKADVHALSGLLNAAFHHEKNEDRFQEKHGVSVEEKNETAVGE